jgi:glycosyltransferase involved in cell wall biosynthesis
LSDNKSVLHCIPGMGGGGAERQLTYLVDGLNCRGWEVHVALVHDGPNMDRLQKSGALIHHIEARNNYSPGIIRQLIGVARAVRPDLIQTWLFQMEILSGLTAFLLGLPWVFSERSSALAYRSPLKNMIRSIAALKADAIISNSWQGDQYWQTKLGNSKPRYIIPNALPSSEIEAACDDISQIKEIEVNQEFILYVGRFDEGKNIDELLLALRELMSQVEVKAVLCGDGPLRAELEERVKKYSLVGRIVLPGYISTVWQLMKRASVFVSVSMFEGHPNTVLEAMACGSPLVVSDIPAHREFLDEESALFVDPCDYISISKAIMATLSLPKEAARRAQNARFRSEQWSTSSMAQKYEHAYLEVLERHKNLVQD